MFNMLTIGYLFLGGTGAGALAVLSVLELLRRWPRRRGRMPRRTAGGPCRLPALPAEVFARAWPLCFVALALGTLCLLADVGRPDRVVLLFASPRLSALAVGSFALAASLVCAAAFSALALFDGVRAPRAGVAGAAVCGTAAGAATMAYTGALLQGMASVLAWQTPLVPALFVLSSLSCGFAVVFAGAAFVEVRRPFIRQLARLVRADGVLVVAEALCLAAYACWALAAEGAAPAARALLVGDLAWLFWGALVAGGLVVPFVLERFLTHGNSRTQLLWVAALVLAGGLALRCCMAGVAAYDVTQMPNLLFGLTG